MASFFDRNRFNDYSLFLLFLVLPLHRNFSTLAILVIALFSIINIANKKALPKNQIDWFLPLLFLYYLASTLLTGGPWSAIEKRLLLVVIPILFWLNPGFFKESLRSKIYWSYIIGILLAETICLIVAIQNSVSFLDGSLTFNAKVFPDAEYGFLTASVRDGNYFFGQEFSLFLHPIYFGIYIVVAQFLIFEILTASKGSYRKVLISLIYFAQFIFLFLLSSKAAIISSFFLTLYLFWTIKLPNSLRALVVIGVIIFSFFFANLNPKMKVFTDTFFAGLSINPNARFGHDLRILSWDASLDIIKNNWLYGVGEGNKDSVLLAKYNEKGYVVPAEEMFNSHNQYLDLFIGGGILGLGLYLFGIIRLVLNAFQYKKVNLPLLIFVMLFSFEALFENFLSRHAGVLLFAVFVTYLNGTKHVGNNA
ncbi:MAG TPA: O-antigen ligase family protein [Cyclobacteriaceae bacterium]|nr:O-antigen ligase family protein [Cyclobacteriaceae bacterium]